MKNTYSKELLFAVLSKIPLDVEGSNLENICDFPSEEFKKYLSEKDFKEAEKEYLEAERKVFFSNVFLQWDRCDCNDGMCSHGSWCYQIDVVVDKVRFEIEFEDAETLYFDGKETGKRSMIPVESATLYDFYRMCEIVGIQLEFSKSAISLFNNLRREYAELKANGEIE